MGKNTLAFQLALPRDYKREVFLAYHAWDGREIAERTTADGLTKGVVLCGSPALLRVTFARGAAEVVLEPDLAWACAEGFDAEAFARHLLGLDQPVEVFEAQYRTHPLLGPLIEERHGLRLPQVSPFEALVRAILGQQVSVKSAIAVRSRFIEAAGQRHASGFYCFPDAGGVLALDSGALQAAGLSRRKSETVLDICRRVHSGELPLDRWFERLSKKEMPAGEIERNLLAIRGIGPWTVAYALSRGFDWLDGSLHGDVGMRRGLERLLGVPGKLTEAEAEEWLKAFIPWRGLVTAYLWSLRAIDGP